MIGEDGASRVYIYPYTTPPLLVVTMFTLRDKGKDSAAVRRRFIKKIRQMPVCRLVFQDRIIRMYNLILEACGMDHMSPGETDFLFECLKVRRKTLKPPYRLLYMKGLDRDDPRARDTLLTNIPAMFPTLDPQMLGFVTDLLIKACDMDSLSPEEKTKQIALYNKAYTKREEILERGALCNSKDNGEPSVMFMDYGKQRKLLGKFLTPSEITKLYNI